MKKMLTITVVLLAAGLILGCAAAPEGAAPGKTIKAKGFLEDCKEISPGRELVFSFTSSRPLDFNLHYHEGDQAVYPVDMKGVASYEGSYRVDSERNYCLMWANPHQQPVKINYTAGIVEK